MKKKLPYRKPRRVLRLPDLDHSKTAVLNTLGITVGSLSMNDFVAAVFGLFAYGRNIKGPAFSLFDMRQIFSQV